MPRGLPDCVPPSDEKIDVKRLKDDIPKFFLSRSFEEHHQKWWMDFLSDKEAVFKVPDPPKTWLLEDIIRIKERQLASADEPSDSRHPPDIQRPANVQPEVESLVARQVVEIPEVKLTTGCNTRTNLIIASVYVIYKSLTHLKSFIIM